MASATISVIIPLYNKEREIGDTLRSVLAQTLQPTEIVVVDDGSTDGSADAVRAIASPLVKLVTQANAGVCAARNRAIAESTGDLIALLDADDTWEPGFLEEIASMAAEFPGCGIYSTAFNIVSHDGRFPAPPPRSAAWSPTSSATRRTVISRSRRPAPSRARYSNQWADSPRE